MVSLKDLERMATGGHWDSTQLPQIARELIAARKAIERSRQFTLESEAMYLDRQYRQAWEALSAYDAAREAE